MSTFKIWSGSTKPSINLTVYEQKSKTQKQVLDLTTLDNAKVVWCGDDGVVQERTMNLVDIPNGVLQYDWVLSDTEEPIYADLWFLLEFNDGTTLIVTSVVGQKDKLHIMATTDPVCDV
jgi:hypothetical protein